MAQRCHRADADLLAGEHDREHLRGLRDAFRQEALRAGQPIGELGDVLDAQVRQRAGRLLDGEWRRRLDRDAGQGPLRWWGLHGFLPWLWLAQHEVDVLAGLPALEA